ncbi:Small-conductance mechanosensitive channel [Citrobacter freundii]|uniref:Small-conductance mechanosensitive channel n=1 Tax=Citrobacter freundii TaxID=546 RepID=A0A7G2IVE4_CITFR|nr:Small-conductance mechanosensitive channel [Citrobacter freundii]
MSGFSLFPKISSGLEWIAGHSDAVIQFGWNIVAAVILLFVGKICLSPDLQWSGKNYC